MAFLVPDCQSNCHCISNKKIELSLLEKMNLPNLAGFGKVYDYMQPQFKVLHLSIDATFIFKPKPGTSQMDFSPSFRVCSDSHYKTP
ncbi:MAG: hypothetical protein C0433_01100 [Cyclobacterium sp.]|nr:hypothetical protein [Cyclobacterium sp.]